ncbi:HNH endonuclease signature motif containing protein [Microbacterium sp. MYb45]|uniref:HNH endonuclease signature motif containing protein n=1 Tax=Microbacterium sp. MYb45 TaxID=1827294 RepID=UPI000D00BD0F|nr:HNH endonuclease signature motif containing protein [Microbacterium sp. MYb45]PRB65676.1 HNH endonuclease [Microbacterium sp. MYb45]
MATHTDFDLEIEERRRVLDAWVEKRRRIAALEAEAADLLVEQIALHDAEVSKSPFHREAIRRSMVAEFSAAGRVSRGSMDFAFADAQALHDHLPAVRAAFAEGSLSAGHVREIARASALIAEAIRNKKVDAGVMALFETAVLVVAEQDTAARTGAHARRVAGALIGESIVERHRRAADERSVTVKSLDDGLALLTAVLPEWIATAISDRLSRMTREVVRARQDRAPEFLPWWSDDDVDAIHPEDFALDDPAFDAYAITAAADSDAKDASATSADADADSDAAGRIFGIDGETFAIDPEIEHVPDDTRTWAQIQADLFTDLLLAGEPSKAHVGALGNIQGRIQVTVAATTLAGSDDRPAELDGHGPLDPDTARALAGHNTGWTRLFLDAAGMLVETDTYTPTEGMRRFLRARDQHCRFPGCRMPTHRCEIDHQHDHAKGGKTRIDNLGHLCRAHHALKHPDVPDPHRWTAQQERDGSITWHSPLGRAYADPPPRRVMFV